MMTALLAARNILGLGQYDTWKVNTDAQYHERAATPPRTPGASRARSPRRSDAPPAPRDGRSLDSAAGSGKVMTKPGRHAVGSDRPSTCTWSPRVARAWHHPRGAIARALADYLLTLNITTKVVANRDGRFGVWVQSEDRLAEARQVYTSSPEPGRHPVPGGDAVGPRYPQAGRGDRGRAPQAEPQPPRPLGRADVPAGTADLRPDRASASRSSSARKFDPRLYLSLMFSLRGVATTGRHRLRLGEYSRGEVWRLVTPIFIHFGVYHILFNMLAMAAFGQRIEMVKGRGKFLPSSSSRRWPATSASSWSAGAASAGCRAWSSPWRVTSGSRGRSPPTKGSASTPRTRSSCSAGSCSGSSPRSSSPSSRGSRSTWPTWRTGSACWRASCSACSVF